ncbi:hypothetical protein ACIHCQ_41255 [Streptomyces sp. NPDC052236]|uniref:hypothetical protein n=1 Tax=Streptomyces sp. NPDC052236 TaxID=3365686 RepID=UPI0037D08015
MEPGDGPVRLSRSGLGMVGGIDFHEPLPVDASPPRPPSVQCSLAMTDPRAALTAAAAMERAALPILTAAADAARAAGDSWTHIGAALGTTRQSAHERLTKSSP